MITVDQIRSAVQQVILSKISLDDFDEWLTKQSWNMHQDSPSEAIHMVGKIELILADYDSDRVNESDVVESLRKLTTPIFVITNVSSGISIVTSASATAKISPQSTRWVAFDKSHAGVSSCTLVHEG